MPEMTPRAFSFNSPQGACPDCQGLGLVHDFDPSRIIPDPRKTLSDGAIAPWVHGDEKSVKAALKDLHRRYEIPLDVPFGKLSRKRARSFCLGQRVRSVRTVVRDAGPGPVRRLKRSRALRV